MLVKGRYAMCTGTHDFIPAEKTAKVELIYTQNNQRVENVFYLQLENTIETDDVGTIAVNVGNAFSAHIPPIFNENTTLVLIRVTDVSVENSFIRDSSVNINGDLLGAGVPGNVTVAVTFASGLTGRSQRGRLFQVGLDDGQIDGNDLTAGTPAAIADAWSDFFAQLATDTLAATHVIASYCHNGSWRTNAQLTPVLSYFCDNHLDSQRRRLTGRGL